MIFALHILRNNRVSLSISSWFQQSVLAISFYQVRKWLLGKVGLGRIFDGKSSTKSSKLHPVSLAGRGEDTLPKSGETLTGTKLAINVLCFFCRF